MNQKKQNIIFLLVVLLFTVVLIIIPTGFENPSLQENTERVKAEITDANNTDLQNHGIVSTGTQNLKIKVLAGMHKGDTISATNVLMGQKRIDKIFAEGDVVLAIVKTDNNKKILTARADDYYRIHIEWILLAVFALFLMGFAGLTGFKALLSFIFTALTLWKVLLPLILKGYLPIISAFAIIVICTTVIIILINGFSKKGVVALVGSISGVGITCCLALLFAHYFRIPGTVQDFSETLLYVGYTHLNLSSIFIACIFIAAAGAVMDVAMDISAAQNEILDHNPSINTKALIRSGFNVAYPVIGTMTTTLLFAYSGSFMFVFMVFMAKGTPIATILNTNYIAAEILKTLVGSFGLVLVAPITAIVGGFIYVRKRG